MYLLKELCHSWWCHQMETFSMLVALCEGNPPVTGGFSSQRPLTHSFDVFFDLRLNKWSSTQSRCQWFETPLHSLWHHCNNANFDIHHVNIWACFYGIILYLKPHFIHGTPCNAFHIAVPDLYHKAINMSQRMGVASILTHLLSVLAYLLALRGCPWVELPY